MTYVVVSVGSRCAWLFYSRDACHRALELLLILSLSGLAVVVGLT